MADQELLDVIDSNDKVVGQATRVQCHANRALRHRVVHFTLIDEANHKVLLTQRSFKKSHDAGKICILGEHVASGESYIDALSRGVFEEMGITIKPEDVVFVGTKLLQYNTQTELAKMYLVKWHGQELSFAENEIEQFLWLPITTNWRNSDLDISEMTLAWFEHSSFIQLAK
jgi:isopentenyldiphosphate isomerase